MNHKRQRLHIWHAYSTNANFSNDTKVNELMILTFILKIANLDLPLGAFMFNKHILFLLLYTGAQ